MTTIPELRKRFTEQGHAALIADAVGGKDLSPQSKWTKRAAWFENDDCVVAVVTPFEDEKAQEVLPYGLHHAGDRELLLVLHDKFAGSTRARLPWIEHTVRLHTYDGAAVAARVNADAPPEEQRVSRMRQLSREESIKRSGEAEKEPTLRLSSDYPLVAELARWASSQPNLEPAHRRDVRAWSHHGQRVLAIRGAKNPQIKAGIDAKAAKLQPVQAKTLTEATLAEVKAAVEHGIAQAASRTVQTAEEHHLQARLAQQPSALGLEHPLLREVPAFRPKGDLTYGRGFIDLVGLDGFGDITLVETKLVGDHMIVLQGLDYWIWAQRNAEWLRLRLHAGKQAEVRLLLAVAGKSNGRPKVSAYAQTMLRRLHPDVTTQVLLIESWTDPATAIATEALP